MSANICSVSGRSSLLPLCRFSLHRSRRALRRPHMATGPNQENQNKRAAQDEADQYVRFGSLMGELPAQTIRQLAANEQKDVVASLDGEDLDARYKEVVPRTDEELYAEFNQPWGFAPRNLPSQQRL